MITQKEAEAFLQSKLALFVGMLIVIFFLFGDRFTLTARIKTLENEKKTSDSIHYVEMAEKNKVIYDQQQQAKIEAANALEVEKARTLKYEENYLKVLRIEAAAKKQNLLK